MAKDNLRGVLLMLMAMALFGIEDMFLKWLAIDLPAGQILLATGFFGVLIFAWLARRDGRRIFTRAALHPWVLARNAGEMVSSLAYIVSLATVPLSTVSAVLQALPLSVTMMAALFLREAVGWRRWSAIAVGFAGVLMVIRPGMEGFRPQGLWVLVAVVGLTLRDLATRLVPAECSTSQVSAWGLGALTLLGAVLVGVHDGLAPISPVQGLILVCTVIFGSAGYWAVTAAARTGEVSVVAPFRYARLLIAMAIGATVFAERPDRLTLLGAGLIIGSGLYSFARERARKRAAVGINP